MRKLFIMNGTASILSIYASDTAGVCSMLYELGGMTVIHDASGCNSTYTTHDEPRWSSTPAMVYISALTETDAILGGDEKLIRDTADAAKELHPAFIALCGSPMPFMTGVDFDALAGVIEARSGIPAFALHTNGMDSYICGAGEALTAYLERFCRRDAARSPDLSCNLLGATPLDFSLNGSIGSVIRLLADSGIRVQSCMAMQSTPEAVAGAGSARVNLVLSASGLPAAKWLRREFGIPYVAGVPFGKDFAQKVTDALRKSAADGQDRMPCMERESGGTAVIAGESICGASLAAALHRPCCVLVPRALKPAFLLEGDRIIDSEDDAARGFAEAGTVIADPLYRPVAPAGAHFIRFPHEAFSGRCFSREIPNLIGRNMEGELC